MATLNINVAVAVLLALSNFGSSSADIRVDYLDPAKNRIETLRIVSTRAGRYDLLTKREGEWLKTGEVAAVPGRKSVYQFGEPGVGQPIDLAAVISGFHAASDRSRHDVSFEARLGKETVKLRQVRSGDVIHLLDVEGRTAFVLHATRQRGN